MSAAGAVPPQSAGHAAPAADKDQHVGPHLGPLTAGDPHVSIRTAVTSSPLAMQPLVGFLTLLIVGILWVLLSVAFGAPQSLETIAASSTFWLPVLIVVAAWWHGWPGSLTKSRPGAGIVNTVIFIVAALVLTGIAQVIVGKADFGAIFHSGGTFPTFPFLIPLAATIFVAMLQLTFVCDRWPFERMKPIPAGLSAFVLCWAIGLLVYFTVINWNFLPAPARAAMGLRNPGGPVNALDFIAWLICLVPYQIIFFQLLSGWPFREFENKVSRLVTSNVFVIGAGWLTYLFLANVLRWPGPTIVGARGHGRGRRELQLDGVRGLSVPSRKAEHGPARPGDEHAGNGIPHVFRPPGDRERARYLDQPSRPAVDRHQLAELHRASGHPGLRDLGPLAATAPCAADDR